jgi:DnaK suppressor protein
LGQQRVVRRLSRIDALLSQAMAAAREPRRVVRTRAIEAALHRIDIGEFGWCETCGEPIGEKRLELDPTLTRCVGCAR